MAIVTGASRGLGGRGCNSREGGRLHGPRGGPHDGGPREAPGRVRRRPGKVVPCTLDLKDDDAVKAFVEKVGKVDVLVNSAYEGLAAQKAHLGKKVLRAADW